MTSAFSWQNSISLCPASFCTPRPNFPVSPHISWLPSFPFHRKWESKKWVLLKSEIMRRFHLYHLPMKYFERVLGFLQDKGWWWLNPFYLIMKEMSSRKAKNLGSIQAADTWIIYVNTCIMEFLEDLKQKHCIATKEKWIWRDVWYEEISCLHPFTLFLAIVIWGNYSFPYLVCMFW